MNEPLHMQEKCTEADEPGTKELPKTFSPMVTANAQTLENDKRTLNEIETIAHESVTENAHDIRMNVRQKLVNHVRCHAPDSEVSIPQRNLHIGLSFAFL